MPLSEEEKRLLAQMEAALAADDPKLAHTLRGAGSRRVHGRRAALAGVGFFVGVALLIVGLQGPWGVSVLGFVLMFVSVALAVTAWARVDSSDQSAPRQPTPSATPGEKSGFMDKMEERWRRRQDDGF